MDNVTAVYYETPNKLIFNFLGRDTRQVAAHFNSASEAKQELKNLVSVKKPVDKSSKP
jgi:hypothetical protein